MYLRVIHSLKTVYFQGFFYFTFQWSSNLPYNPRSKNTIEEYDKLDEFQKQSQLISHLGKLSKIRKEYFEKDFDQFTDSDNTSDSDSE